MEFLGLFEDLLPWIFRIFVILFIFRLIRNAFRPAPQPQRPAGTSRQNPPERLGGQLVRDPQCGTFVPLATSIQLASGKTTLYFCSTSCRDAYRQAHSSVA
jgi:YHS domain-containing protein